MCNELKFLIDLVQQASHLINDELVVNAKDDKGDLVTNFDYEIEKYIINEIKENYPSFSIISEEFNNEKGLTDNCFIIDPIDGTVNFAHHIPLWGIQVACIRDKKTCSSVIYLPELDEIYYADEDGAFLNGKPISVNSYNSHKGLYIVEGPNSILGEVKMKKLNPHCRHFHCAAVDFAWVACGRISATNFVNLQKCILQQIMKNFYK